MVRALSCALLFVGLLSASTVVCAQQQPPTPDKILGILIRGLQTGQANPNWFGQELQGVISQQTGGRFVYPQLVSLGEVQNIRLMAQQPVPNGVIYNLRAFHATGGVSEWQMGISRQSNRIEYLAVEVVGRDLPSGPMPGPAEPQRRALPKSQDPQPAPQPAPSPPSPPVVGPKPQPPPQPPVAGPGPMPSPSPVPPDRSTGGSEACRLYPNLC